MYLKSLNLNNFRKFQNLQVEFTKGLNLLVGENDAGKTAIVDAIKYVLNTQSFDYIRPSYEDFFNSESDELHRKNDFYIECIFEDLRSHEASSFLEWLGFYDDGKSFLKIWLSAKRKDRKIFYEIRSGADDEGSQLSAEARDYLRVTYLKALRDAESELSPKKGSRLSQILDSHEIFEDKENHELKEIMRITNESIEKYFSTGNNGEDLMNSLNSYLKDFSLASNKLESKFLMSGSSLKSILEKLGLKIFNSSENNSQGLGSQNILYIAAELLLLKKTGYAGLKLGLIEEIEAHLHPQTQIKLIESIQSIGESNDIQFIMTTHSPNLASKIKLENLIVIKNGNAYPMGSEYTKLEKGDYYFLERFLNSTKANLFFANGVILVEGDAENILLPTIAKKIGKNLSDYGVSIVNVGSVAFLRYSTIFLRKVEPHFTVPVAVITDVDVKPFESKELFSLNIEKISNFSVSNKLLILAQKIVKKKTKYYIERNLKFEEVENKRINTIDKKLLKYDEGKVKSFIAPYWTLEYTIALSCLSKLFYQAVYICKKTYSRDYVYTESQKNRFIEEANTKYYTWESSGRTKEEIAFIIYNDIMIKESNPLSKAVVAQVFGQILNETDLSTYNIETDDKLKYLVDAINYVTSN
ncbi:ATP-dependent nuclease [Aliarcobacter lanthieri]|uniref:ATP-dependent nuclease n=1 Tax=Aliarcobacter lanthieri TaxID=1355374 RepID=UPI003AAACDFE